MFAETDWAASVNCDLSLKSATDAREPKGQPEQIHAPLPNIQLHITTVQIASFSVFHKSVIRSIHHIQESIYPSIHSMPSIH